MTKEKLYTKEIDQARAQIMYQRFRFSWIFLPKLRLNGFSCDSFGYLLILN